MTAELVRAGGNGLSRSVLESYFEAAEFLAVVGFEHPDLGVRAAARALLRHVPAPGLKLAENPKDPSECTVDDLGIVVLVASDHQVEALDQGFGHEGVVGDAAQIEGFHGSSSSSVLAPAAGCSRQETPAAGGFPSFGKEEA